MNSENEEKNTVIERTDWHATKYCCENMSRYINGGFALKLKIHHTGAIVFDGDLRGYTEISFCPNCGAKVITK